MQPSAVTAVAEEETPAIRLIAGDERGPPITPEDPGPSRSDTPTESNDRDGDCDNDNGSSSNSNNDDGNDAKTTSTAKADSLSDSAKGKRKADTCDTSNGAPPAKVVKSRMSLTHGQKMEILEHLKEKMRHASIARTYGCSERTVANIAQRRKVLEEYNEKPGCNLSNKRRRQAEFPEVRFPER